MNTEQQGPIMGRLLLALKKNDIPVAKLRKGLGISSQIWNNWRSRHDVPASRVASIAEFLGISASWLLTGNGFMVDSEFPSLKVEANAVLHGDFDLWDCATPLNDDEVAVPFFSEVFLAAGIGVSEVKETYGCKLRFSKSTLRKSGVEFENAVCVKVLGSSMEPVLPDGTTVGVDRGIHAIHKDGDLFALDHCGHLRVKMLYTIPGGYVRLRSFNVAEWPDEVVDAQSIKIIGRVFWWSVLR